MNYRRRLEAQSRRSAALGIAGEVVMARYFRLEASGDIWISPMSVDGRTDWIGDALVIDDPAIEVDTVCWHMIEYAGAAAQAAWEGRTLDNLVAMIEGESEEHRSDFDVGALAPAPLAAVEVEAFRRSLVLFDRQTGELWKPLCNTARQMIVGGRGRRT